MLACFGFGTSQHKKRIYPFTSFIVKVDENLIWESTMMKILKKTKLEISGFKVCGEGMFQISGMLDPKHLLKVLWKTDRTAHLVGLQSRGCSENLYMSDFENRQKQYIKDYNQYIKDYNQDLKDREIHALYLDLARRYGQCYGYNYGQGYGQHYGYNYGNPYVRTYGHRQDLNYLLKDLAEIQALYLDYYQRYAGGYGQGYGYNYGQSYGQDYGYNYGNPYVRNYGHPQYLHA
ncbi:hypothetical protein POM88_050936 [Heracleum sosnowskyi]|uniref:Uncharacterized protein n=1 Tax=Heracleum sosnowskyi TaxID=360622 RepID=A0AAD8GYG7_9APIA|nr:hypothetical protein POM88_050936 [Heracleum sosnowskyi]